MIKRVILTFLLLTSTLCLFSQPHTWPDSLNTAKYEVAMSELEKAVVFEMNKVRSNPKAYANLLLQERDLYIGVILKKDGLFMRTKEGVNAVDECIEFLNNTVPVKILYPNQNLNRAARHMAKDKSEKGQRGHKTSDGLTMQQRVEQYIGENYLSLGENISYGFDDAYSIVIQLLIDDGVVSRGHRKNLVDAEFTHCGVAFGSHPNYVYLCIIDYARFLPDPLH